MVYPGHGLSEPEFEEIMGRNRTVSSSAIARAVQDAANGEFASAIETLVTAISLIKQSKVANDDRCKILISSLQDTLHGIESKSYAGRSSHHHHHHSRSPERRHRSYGRHHSPERYRERSPRSYDDRDRFRVERSRSRDRDYRREKDYYDDARYRERMPREPREERDRDRERERERGGGLGERGAEPREPGPRVKEEPRERERRAPDDRAVERDGGRDRR